MKNRTMQLSLNAIQFCLNLPKIELYKILSRQLIRASSSVGANYRAACRAKSKRDFINKLKIVEEECDEVMFFFQLIASVDNSHSAASKPIIREANEILSIVVASIKTAKNIQSKH